MLQKLALLAECVTAESVLLFLLCQSLLLHIDLLSKGTVLSPELFCQFLLLLADVLVYVDLLLVCVHHHLDLVSDVRLTALVCLLLL